MTTGRRISFAAPAASTTESPLETATSGSGEARSRVGRMSLSVAAAGGLVGGGWAAAALFGIVSWHSASLVCVPTAAGVAVSVALFALCRVRRVPDRRFVPLGLAYVVTLCFLGSVVHLLHEADRYGRVTAFGPPVLVIAMFPLLLPSPPRLTALTALASVVAVVAGAFAASLEGHASMSVGTYVDVASVPLACALLAYFVSRRISRLQSEAARARRLGSYQLEEKLGEGGMGEVWRARHHLLARSAAIKLIQQDRLDPRPEGRRIAIERFYREAQAIASLESMHTVRLFDFGATSDGTLYYAMELLDGIDLATLVREHGPLPPERVRRVLLQICDSLGEAHELGLVHRDVKPANVILCRLGRGYDVVKVLDFGIVALQTEFAEGRDGLTGAGVAIGSPGFMAPEALAGEACDARADIYSVGCVAYWLLTGRRVFEVASRALEVAAVMRDPVVPPSSLGYRVPADLERIVLSCLAKFADDRPESIDDLAEALSRCTPDEPWDQARARAWWERHGSPRAFAGAPADDDTPRATAVHGTTRRLDAPAAGDATRPLRRRADGGEPTVIASTLKSRVTKRRS